jgi:hypothetical protein
VAGLRHIEGFSQSRVDWVADKIRRDGRWTKPLAIDDEHDLVLDGQHRMEAARILGLEWVPAVRYRYADVHLWSLRAEYTFSWREVTRRALSGDIYPYKTVKHRFEPALPAMDIPLEDLFHCHPSTK